MSWRDRIVPGVLADDLGQVRGHHGRAVHHRDAGDDRLVAELGGDPLGPSAEGRVPRLDPGQLLEVLAHRQELPPRRLAPSDLDPLDPDRVDGRGQVEVVARVDLGHDDAELRGDVAPQRLDPVEQVAAALGLDEVDQLEPELQDELLHGDAGGDRLGRVRGSHGAGACSGFGLRARPASLGSRVPKKKTLPPTRRNGSFGSPGMMARPAMTSPVVRTIRR